MAEEENSLNKKSAGEMHETYLKRRFMLLGSIVAVLVLIALILALLPQPVSEVDEDGPTPNTTPAPIFEKDVPEPEPEPEPVDNTTNDTEEECIPSPLDYLGCLEANEGETIFDAYGMRPDDDNVEDVLDLVEAKCRLGENPDRQCIVKTAFTESENNWACEWECLEDMASCPSYKTHLAVAVLREFVPPTDAFVGRTDDFEFFMLYKEDPSDNDSWTQPRYIPVKDPRAEVLYNDVYHTGELDNVVIPDVIGVEPGEEFCFEFYSDSTCECKVEVGTFNVGDCPELPADMRGICEDPISEVYITPGKNEVCFLVDEDADDELYTYKFELTDGEDHWFAGNALITTEMYNCCVDVEFEGFLEVDD
jgi:hypothetical protein